jgi:signal transduction histidine kinase
MKVLVAIVVVFVLGIAAASLVVARKVDRIRRSAAEGKAGRERRIREGALPSELRYVVGQIDLEIEQLDGDVESALAGRLSDLRGVLVRNHECRTSSFAPVVSCEAEVRGWRRIVPDRRIACSFPKDSSALQVAGDPDLFGWALRELFANVRSHAGEWSNLEVKIERTDDTLVLSVADDGEGPGPMTAARLYGAFTPRIGSPGPGLGLFAVRTIVERMGGSIHARPGAPSGLVHVLRLPLAPSTTPPPEEPRGLS